MRVLGVDYGERRVGLALGDTEARIASPWGIIDLQKEDWLARLQVLIAQERIQRIVIGVPLDVRTAGETSRSLRHRRVQEELTRFGIPVDTEQEMFTSQQADRQRADQPATRRETDDLAAALILQSWLDRHGVSS